MDEPHAPPLTVSELAGLPRDLQVVLWTRHLLRLLPLGGGLSARDLRLIDSCGKWQAVEIQRSSGPLFVEPGWPHAKLRDELSALEGDPPDPARSAASLRYLLLANGMVALEIGAGIEPRREFLSNTLPRTGLGSEDLSPQLEPAFTDLRRALRLDREGLGSRLDAIGPGKALQLPLWPGVESIEALAGIWPDLVEELARTAKKQDLGALHREYLALAKGRPLDWKAVRSRLARWEQELAAPPPKPRAKPRKTRRKPSPPKPPPDRPNLLMLDDAPLEDDAADSLDFKVYADALAGLIDNPETGTPLTLAINGPWGSGKTTLARMVQRRLETKPAAAGDRPHVTCWFNAWMHDEAEQLAAAFASAVAQAAERQRPLWRRLVNPLPTAMRPPGERIGRRIAVGLGIVATAVLVALVVGMARASDGDIWNKVVEVLRGVLQLDPETLASLAGKPEGRLVLALIGLFTAGRWLATAAGAVSRFIQNPKKTANEGAMGKVRDQLGRLIRQATPGGSRFVVFVDDLERCRPPGPVDVLEVVNQLLPHEEIVTVVIADMPAVVACAEIKYAELAERYQPDGRPFAADGPRHGVYGRFYLQKMIQMQFDLPRQRSETIRSMLDGLAAEAVADDEAGADDVESAREGPHGPLELLRVRWAGSKPRLAGFPMRLLVFPWTWVSSFAARQAYPPPMLPTADPGALMRVLSGLRFPLLSLYIFSLAASLYLAFDWLWTWMRGTGVAAEESFAPWRPVAKLLSSAGLPRPESLGSLLLLLAGLLAGSLALNGLRAWSEARLQRRRDSRLLEKVRRVAREKSGDDDVADAEALTRKVVEDGALRGVEGVDAYAQEALNLRLVNESDLLAEAQKTVLIHLPKLPRSAKRLLNHLRLMLFIAHGRGVFGGRPMLRPAHIGKWVVLRERWPELAQRLTREPGRLADLEAAAAEPDDFDDRLAALELPPSSSAALREFCRKTPKNLGKVLERLVHFQPLGGRGPGQPPP